MSFWNYRGRCIGRVIHFLYHYAGMDVAEHARIGGDSVEYRGKPFAKFTWSDRVGRCDVPEFVFVDDDDKRLSLAQITKEQQAISDGCAVEVFVDGRIRVPKEVLRILIRDGYHSANIFCQGVHGTKPGFFALGDRLFAEANGWVYAWAPEAKNWMLWVKGDREARCSATDASEAVQP